ncbi:MAG: HAD family phosphatase [Candidatus Omnitrophica bacterium]|nr:HAD family phosphatase [Candidatus Omnitrophota bacterium]
MYKLISLDLDGTLLSDDGTISRENISCLKEFSEKGGIVVLSSGRMTGCISPFAEMLGIDCPLIAYNGAMAKLNRASGRRIIYHNPVGPAYADMLIDYCAENNFLLNYYLQDVLYAQDDENLRKYAEIYSCQTGAVYHPVKNLKMMKGNSPTKMILITDAVNGKNPFRSRDFQYGYFKNKIGDGLNVLKTNPEYLEFMNIGSDKGTALAKIADYFNLGRDEIIALGDGENDISMLEYAGLSAAPANAGEKVKKSADVVLEWDNNRSAAGKFLSKILH